MQEVQVDGIPAHVLQRELHDTQITAWVVVSSTWPDGQPELHVLLYKYGVVLVAKQLMQVAGRLEQVKHGDEQVKDDVTDELESIE